MSSYYECDECHALTGKHDADENHRPSCSKSTAYQDADDRIAELEHKVEALEARLSKLEAVAPPPEDLDPTKPLYVGDGLPRVKEARARYERDSEEEP